MVVGSGAVWWCLVVLCVWEWWGLGGGGGEVWGGVWEVVVVVRTLCLYDVSVHATQLLAMNWVAGRPGVKLPATSPHLPRRDGGGQPSSHQSMNCNCGTSTTP